jgi:predicted RNA-binding protein with PIN domain
MRNILLVDGYNVIHAWPELSACKDNLEDARDKLIDIMASYGAFQNLEVNVIFDANAVKGSAVFEQLIGKVTVIYTREGETADSHIEKMAYDMVRQRKQVYVVTSDWVEQLVILGAGAYRISARELLQDVKKVNKLIKEGYSESELTYKRHELENRLTSDVVKRLDELRKRM